MANVSFYPSDAGGRRGPTPAHQFRCLAVIDDVNVDVYFVLTEHGPLAPGETANVPFAFLSEAVTRRYCFRSRTFLIRDGRIVGDGVILESYAMDENPETLR